MPKPLVIVESPAKAKTIARFLGDNYIVESSIGHIRDLPRSAAEVPAAYKSESWSRLGVDVDNGFKPLYVVASEKKPQVSKLRSLLKNASELYLATDEDREGESIAWHLLEVLSPQIPVKRMVFHEITKPAIDDAIAHPRDLDRRLVDAEEARRILDRLYGYELSPVLWKKVMQGLSAGRVQSVATRHRRRARAGADAFPLGDVVEPHRTVQDRRQRVVHRRPRRDRWATRRHRHRFHVRRRSRRSVGTGLVGSGRGERARVGACAVELSRLVRRHEAVPAIASCALHHLDAPAGGGAEAPFLRVADDAGRAAAVRAGFHHLHADRLDDAVGHCADRGSRAGAVPLRKGIGAESSAHLRPPCEERPGSTRSDPARGRHVPCTRGRLPRRWEATDNASTS